MRSDQDIADRPRAAVDVARAAQFVGTPVGGRPPALAKPLKSRQFDRRQRTCFTVSKVNEENAMKHVARLALSLAIALAPSVVQAQEAWPGRSITFVVPYAPGGYPICSVG